MVQGKNVNFMWVLDHRSIYFCQWLPWLWYGYWQRSDNLLCLWLWDYLLLCRIGEAVSESSKGEGLPFELVHISDTEDVLWYLLTLGLLCFPQPCLGVSPKTSPLKCIIEVFCDTTGCDLPGYVYLKLILVKYCCHSNHLYESVSCLIREYWNVPPNTIFK